MEDLRHVWNRLVAVDMSPKFVSLRLDDGGMYSVCVEWLGRSKECTRASTPREAVQVALDDLLDPVYSRKQRG